MIRKEGGFGVTKIASEIKNRPEGALDVRTGTLELSQEGTLEGTAQVASGCVLALSGTFTAPTTFTISGPGTARVSGILTLGPGATLAANDLDVFTGPGGAPNIAGAGTINVASSARLSGRWFGSLTLNLAPGCLSFVDATILDFQETTTLNNRGGLIWTQPNISLAGGTSINNLPGSIMECRGTASLTGFAFSGTGSLNNQGLLIKTMGGRNEILVPFVNTGRVECAAGVFAFSDFRQTAGETVLSGGTLDADFQIQPLRFEGGALRGAGVIDGPVVNSGGLIAPDAASGESSIGTIALANGNYGNSFTQAAGGTLEIEIGGSEQDQYDRLVIVSDHPFLDDVTLDGTLHVRLINGFNPTAATIFDVVVRDGPGSNFGAFTSVEVPPGFHVVYMQDRVRLEFVPPGSCLSDFNLDGSVNPDDLGDFINCYFAETGTPGSCPEADFNGEVDPGVNADDLGDFINTYFGPPC